MTEPRAAAGAVALAARGLSGGYGGAAVVRQVDLEVRAGDCLAVLGPNGAGKSTLLRLLTGILPATAGTAELYGRSLSLWKRRDAARILGYVPQSVSIAFPLSVLELVHQGRAPHLGPWRPPAPHDHEAVDTAIRRVGLAGRERVAVQRLSGGERQLVLLARALAGEPRILLLDEPITALDVRHQLGLAAIVGELTAAGVAVVVIAHDWNFAVRVASHVAVLDGGRLRAAGRPDEVLRPELFRAVFGVEVDLVERTGSLPVIVPRSPAPRKLRVESEE